MESLRTPLTVAPGQLSKGVAMPGSTTAEHCPVSLLVMMLAGAVTVGFWMSLTVTENVHESEPWLLVAVTVTVAVPTGKLPESGE